VKILQITSAFLLNGAARYAAAMSKGLALRGHDVILLKRPSLDVSAMLKMPDTVRTETSTLRRVPDEVRRIGAFCRAEGIDVIHTHMSSAHAFGALLRLFYRIPCVATAHKLNLQLHWAVNDRVICHNDESMRYMRRVNLVRPSRLRKVPAWVDETYLDVPAEPREQTRRRLGVPQGKILLTTVGNIEPRKGLMDLVEAMPQVVAAGHDVVHVLCGADINLYRSHLEQRARELGVAERLMFAGQLPDTDMVRLMQATDLYVQPSRIETGPLVVLEAMALGLPVVGTVCGSMPEFVVPGETGDLVPVEDPAALARSIAASLGDPARLTQMGESARQRFNRHYGSAAANDAIEAILQEAADLRRRRRRPSPSRV
jgi:glycosyltransferase involved in cell wall biosynthesis